MKNRFHIFLNSLAIPTAIIFALDLRTTHRLIIFFILASGAGLMSGIATFISACWQSLCVAALFSLLLFHLINFQVSGNFAVITFSIFLCFVIYNQRRNSGFMNMFHRVDIKRDLVSLLLISLIAAGAPRGDLEKFSSILAEDNEGWVRAPLNMLRNDQIDFSSRFDTTAIQYFVNFSLGFFTRLFGESPAPKISVQTTAVHIVANSWLFLLISGIIIVLFLTSDLWNRVFGYSNSILLYSVTGIIQLGYYRASLLNGHYSQFLLNLTVLTLFISLIEVIFERRERRPWKQALIGFAVSMALFGSYSPWIPISIGSAFLIINYFSSTTFLAKVYRSRYFPITFVSSIGVLVLIYLTLSDRYGALDDGGGIWIVGTYSLWFATILVILVSIILTSLSVNNNLYLRFESQINLTRNEVIAAGMIFSSSLLIDDSIAVIKWISTLILGGALATRVFFGEIGVKVSKIKNDRTYMPIFFLCVGSYIFIVYIWLVSRFTGSVRGPMYAAHKALLAFSGQFFWILVCLFLLKIGRRKIFILLRNAVVGILLIPILGLQPLVTGDKTDASIDVVDNLGGNWWVSPIIDTYVSDKNTFVACVNGDWTVDDISVYNCNRFSSSLSVNGGLATNFRYLAWKQKDQFSRLRDYVSEIPLEQKITVISHGVMTVETRSLFNLRASNIEFVEVTS